MTFISIHALCRILLTFALTYTYGLMTLDTHTSGEIDFHNIDKMVIVLFERTCGRLFRVCLFRTRTPDAYDNEDINLVILLSTFGERWTSRLTLLHLSLARLGFVHSPHYLDIKFSERSFHCAEYIQLNFEAANKSLCRKTWIKMITEQIVCVSTWNSPTRLICIHKLVVSAGGSQSGYRSSVLWWRLPFSTVTIMTQDKY